MADFRHLPIAWIQIVLGLVLTISGTKLLVW
jgi:hypothetical protein